MGSILMLFNLVVPIPLASNLIFLEMRLIASLVDVAEFWAGNYRIPVGRVGPACTLHDERPVGGEYTMDYRLAAYLPSLIGEHWI